MKGNSAKGAVNTTLRKSVSRTIGVGVTTGLSERQGFEAGYTYSDAAFNASSSGAAGRPTSGGGYYRGVKGKRGNVSVNSKGYSFDIEGCGGMDENSPIGEESTQP